MILRPTKYLVKPNQQAINQFAVETRKAELVKSIKERTAKIKALDAQLDSVEIIEQEVMIDGRKMVTLQVEGQPEGICIDYEDIITGKITRKEGYKAMADLMSGSDS